MIAGLALVALSGCQARLEVDVDAGTAGSGEVRATVVLDREAAEQVPDLAGQLRVGDLERAGWRVEAPSRRSDGGSQIRAVKPFRSAAGAARALRELGGDEGPFRDLRLHVDRSYLRTRTALTGTVDLSSGLEGFSDEVLRQRLGSPLGVDPATVERQLGRPLRDVVTFRVRALLPGEDPAVVTPSLGQRVEVRASAERWNVERLVFGAVALVAGVALVGVLLGRLRSG